jgi:UDP-N-acetylglucosamine 2-epimerase
MPETSAQGMSVPSGAPPVILVLFGTRPEAIKLAPVIRALAARPEPVDVHVVSTGQHSELLDSAVLSLNLRVGEDLAIMQADQDLYDVGVRCLDLLRSTLRARRPDVLVVEGDTATVFFGALAAFFQRTPVAHVEAGLRSGNKWHPFPEEIFRQLTDVVTDHYFAPTPRACGNLLGEGVPEERINVTGNTVVDALHTLASVTRSVENPRLKDALGSGRRLILITAHRRESFGAPIREAFSALRALAQTHTDDLFIYPAHLNPNIQAPAREIFRDLPNFWLLEPLSYSDLIQALSRAWVVFTDSGGIQEEAPSFGVPVLVMRQVTERPEGVEAGVAALVGTSQARLLELGRRLLDDARERERMISAQNPYGDGRAGERIADILIHRLLGVPRQTEDWA